jgi:predicted small lipoprotein YifL
MRSAFRSFALAACGAALVACGESELPPEEPTPPQQQEDPCAPHGHIHREPTGDWCHCDRGYLAASQGLACQADPNYVPRDGFDFGDDGVHACWHVDNGPYGTVSASTERLPRVDAFHTLYTVNLREVNGGYTGTFQFKAFATGDFIVYLSQQVPLAVLEGTRAVPIAAEKPTTACAGLQHMVGLELTDKVTYTFTLGPTPLQQLRMVTEYLP